MIILQTGVPGSGKTASVVAMLMNDESYTYFTDKDGVRKKRPLFVSGIDELLLEHTPLNDEQIFEQPLQDFLPYGSLVVIDEVQRLMGTRSAASKVPHYIEALATHRHHGLDIILITQHPSFLDPFVRKLVQRHIHISIKAVGRKLYEWNECVDQPDSSVNIAKAIERQFKLPKQVFGHYKSAEVHTKPKRRIPKSLVFLILFLPVLTVFGYYTFARLKNKYMGDEQAISEQAASVPMSAGGTVHDVGGLVDAPAGQSLTAEMFAPTIPEKPESKPLYDGVRQVKTFERVVACVEGGKTGCTCYSDQATALVEISKAQCLKYVENGLPFDPYREPQEQQLPQQAEPQQEATAEQMEQQVITLSGEPQMPKSQDYPKRLQDIQ
ncbi:zonular occludens toxin family protein [Conchiformibius kuhniae]|uniref:Zonular occludens toxin family protein n=1 Tax=Conchiformibius kuhniae TaxID=211502 RepID=A0A8T9MTQ2_9NEIS|nr:zonular occludens toxin domain-containing protein [Conchiformibius kuhniae]UOP04474.1 zonular occludens toxin domain-containing protein [Conchiformibius kuhniae]